MSLQALLDLSSSKNNKKIGYSEERIRKIVPELRKAFSFYREYPDIYAEFLCGSNPEHFSLYAYQRVFLRAVMRHKYSYATYPRAYSKSFLAFLVFLEIYAESAFKRGGKGE